MINVQLSFEEKRNFSDIILDNSDDQNKWIKTIREVLSSFSFSIFLQEVYWQV